MLSFTQSYGYLRYDNMPSIGDWGGVGVLQTRNARFLEEGFFAAGFARAYPNDNTYLTFQPFSFVETTLRYVTMRDWNGTGKTDYDRNFDIKIKILDEGVYHPSFAIGFQDFLGTRRFRGEYIVASKEIWDFDLSAGLGWGRLGSRGGLKNPFTYLSKRFENRSSVVSEGGKPGFKDFFRGKEVAPFFGIEYKPEFIQGLKLKAEWSGDNNTLERLSKSFRQKTPINVGFSYQPNDWAILGAHFEHGHQIGFNVTLFADLKRAVKLLDRPPVPVKPIVEKSIFDEEKPKTVQKEDYPFPVLLHENKSEQAGTQKTEIAAKEYQELLKDGIAIGVPILKIIFDDDQKLAYVYARNIRYRLNGRAVGRLSRVLTHYIPDHIPFYRIILQEKGMNMGTFLIDRRKINKIDDGQISNEEIWDKVDYRQLKPCHREPEKPYGFWDRFSYYIDPRLSHSLFDPDNPYRYRINAAPGFDYHVAKGLYVGGELALKVIGNLDSITRESNSVLPRVRSDVKRYAREGKYALDYLQADYFYQLCPDIYTRLSAGYLEQMFGGVSAEALYHNFDNRFALGLEVNQVWQRHFDVRLGFRKYHVLTGHGSFYYTWPFGGLESVIHAGRYLAKDWGLTFQMSKRFDNGIVVGGFFTKTDVSSKDFGEGSFDKGIFVSIPLEYMLNTPSQSTYTSSLKPLTRDGGARLFVRNRLYGITNNYKRGLTARDFMREFNK